VSPGPVTGCGCVSRRLLCASWAPPRWAPVLAAPRRPAPHRTGAGGGSCLESPCFVMFAVTAIHCTPVRTKIHKAGKLFQDQGSARDLDAQGLLQSVLQQAQVLADLRAFRQSAMAPPRTSLGLGRCALVLGAQRTLPETRPPSPAKPEKTHTERGDRKSREKVGFSGALGLDHGHLVGPCGSTAQVAQLEPGTQTL